MDISQEVLNTQVIFHISNNAQEGERTKFGYYSSFNSGNKIPSEGDTETKGGGESKGKTIERLLT